MKALIIADEGKTKRLQFHGLAENDSAHFASTEAGLQDALSGEAYQVALVDLEMRGADGPAMLRALHRAAPSLPIVVLHSPVKGGAIEENLGEQGVCAKLIRPFSPADLRTSLIAHALPLPPRSTVPGAEVVACDPNPPGEDAVFSADPLMRKTTELAERAAASNATILILGESGTGKTVLSRFIHRRSPLASKPLVTVNCPCLSRELLESELFGHVKGAFTGAVQETWGKVAAAEGGTLFLDEIGELPSELQAKLLRLLQEKEYERLGEACARHANVRVIAATNRDLKAAVASGAFREDLYYRLNVISFAMPPLRQRPLDLALAAEQFVEAICRQLGRPLLSLSARALQRLQACSWPGNLRELRNVIERAVVLCEGACLDAEDFPDLLEAPAAASPQIGEQVSLRDIEEAHIREVVARSPSLDYAARILGIDKSTLYRKRLRMQPQISLFPLGDTAAPISV